MSKHKNIQGPFFSPSSSEAWKLFFFFSFSVGKREGRSEGETERKKMPTFKAKDLLKYNSFIVLLFFCSSMYM